MGNILVAGATSFIGQHLIRELLKKGNHITGLVRSQQKIPGWWGKNVRILQGDITEKRTISGICKEMDVIFHLAAKVHDFSSGSNAAEEHFAVNVIGTKNLLDECANSGIRHFVYFSSVKAMVEDKADNLDESFMPCPATPYGKSKNEAEKLVAEYGKKHGFKTTSLRLPLVYGPGNKGNIYRMIEAVDRGRFIMVGKGENRRSMVYVGNVIDATLSVIEKQRTRKEVYILTDGVDYTVKELYGAIAKEIGKKPLPFYVPLNIAKVVAFIGDVGGKIAGKPLLFNSNVLEKLSSPLTFSSLKIQSEIEFMPRYNLYNTITEILEWYKNSK